MGPILETDYLVVGAGSAGCVVAARLSEDPDMRVTLLEAGPGDRNLWLHIPFGFGKAFTDRKLNWCFETEPETAAGGRRIYWPRGKVLGGSSSINGLLYVRGQAEDFDLWRQMGCDGWSFADVLPYFRRSENNARFDDRWHGRNGPLGISDIAPNPFCDAFIRAAKDAGYPANDDFNGDRQDGVGYHQTTTRNGRRSSTAVAFLRPAIRRANLQVITEAHTTRILFEGRRAVGVSCSRAGETCVLRAAREVILAAGTIGSPHLLMLSGIGPGAHLAANGIDVVRDAPGVGQGLQDHYGAAIKLKCRFPITANDVVRSKIRLGLSVMQYALFRRGTLTLAAADAALFARTRPELATPDVKLTMGSFSFDRPQDGLHRWSGFSVGTWQLRPESQGEIRLRSADPFDAPAIRPNYLATPTDRRTLVAGLRIARGLLASPALQHFISAEYAPGPGVQTDDELLAYARETGGTTYHPTGTCRMGTDPAAVVDPALRVRGVTGLRVVDASIMPTIVSANTNAAAIMIGEKGAALIRGEERVGQPAP